MAGIIRIGISALALAAAIETTAAADNHSADNTVGYYSPEFVAPLRVVIRAWHSYLRPNAKRYCRSWLAKEYRVSGPVIVPKMHCWWR